LLVRGSEGDVVPCSPSLLCCSLLCCSLLEVERVDERVDDAQLGLLKAPGVTASFVDEQLGLLKSPGLTASFADEQLGLLKSPGLTASFVDEQLGLLKSPGLTASFVDEQLGLLKSPGLTASFVLATPSLSAMDICVAPLTPAHEETGTGCCCCCHSSDSFASLLSSNRLSPSNLCSRFLPTLETKLAAAVASPSEDGALLAPGCVARSS